MYAHFNTKNSNCCQSEELPVLLIVVVETTLRDIKDLHEFVAHWWEKSILVRCNPVFHIDRTLHFWSWVGSLISVWSFCSSEKSWQKIKVQKWGRGSTSCQGERPWQQGTQSSPDLADLAGRPCPLLSGVLWSRESQVWESKFRFLPCLSRLSLSLLLTKQIIIAGTTGLSFWLLSVSVLQASVLAFSPTMFLLLGFWWTLLLLA